MSSREPGQASSTAAERAASKDSSDATQSEPPPEHQEPAPYPFEKRSPRRRVESEEHDYLSIFKDRLKIARYKQTSDTKLETLLREFVDGNHLAIVWYERARKREIVSRDRFRNGSICLLIAIPLVVAALPLFIDKFQGPQVTALVTAVLTAMIGTQKAIGTWMNQRQLVGVFWKASADLKENVYKLERKWEGGAIDPQAPPAALLEDLSLGIERAHEVTRTEQDAFFATFAAPTLDLGAALTSAGNAAAGVWRTFAAETVKQQEARVAESRKAIAELTAAQLTVRKLKAERDAVATLIENAADTAKLLYQKKLDALGLELTTAEAELAARVMA